MSRGAASVIAFLLLSAGCSSPAPTAPSVPSQPITNSRLSGPLRMFAFASPAPYPVSHYTQQSSIRLYDNGAFALDYPSGSYAGTYTERGGNLVFEWDGGSGGGVWGATGTISGDILTVRYNLVMQLSDFEDAVYLRVR